MSAISSRDHLIAKLRNVWRLADAARDAINRAKEKAETDPSLAHGFLILALFYPLVAIGGAILTVAAAVSFPFRPTAPRSATVPIYAAVAFVTRGVARHHQGSSQDAQLEADQ